MLCFIESQWNMPYPEWKCLVYNGTVQSLYYLSNTSISYQRASNLVPFQACKPDAVPDERMSQKIKTIGSFDFELNPAM